MLNFLYRSRSLAPPSETLFFSSYFSLDANADQRMEQRVLLVTADDLVQWKSLFISKSAAVAN